MKKIRKKIKLNRKNIIKYLAFFILFFAIVIIQVNYLNRVLIFEVKPDLFLLCIFLISLYKGIFYGTISGFIFGLIEDSLSGYILGTNALAKTFVGYFINILSKYFQTGKLLLQSLLLFILYYFNAFLLILISSFFSKLTLNINLLKNVFWGSVYTLVIGIFVLWGIKLLRNED